MNTVSENILERVTNIKNEIGSNVKNNKRIPMLMSDIQFIKAVSGGTIRIDNSCTNSPIIYEKLQRLEENLSKAGNVIFSSSESLNGSNLIIGNLVDVILNANSQAITQGNVLRNIDLLVIPDREAYRNIRDTKLKKGSVCQKLLELKPNDIVDTVFKLYSNNIRLDGDPTIIRCTEDLIELTNGDDFILLFNHELAFMVASIEDEEGKTEQQFYLINGRKSAAEPIQKQEDYSILSLYISTPELFGE